VNSESPLKPSGKQVPRRRFLQAVTAFFATLWGLLTLYPLYRYLRPSAQSMQGQASVSSVTVGDASELPAGQGQNFQFGSVPGIVVHSASDNQFHAFNAVCTHLGCTVQFRADMDRIWCACHGGQYDPITGKNIAGPPPRPLEPLKVTVQNGKIIVSQA
jgi:cytochrome b6-f complex iron-sulfur subunit